MKVFLNPGHAPNGNPDPGSPGGGYWEHAIVWEIGIRVQRYLIAAGVQCDILQHDTLGYICEVANASDADIFVSIHMNGFENPAANGTEVFSGGSIRANTLANCILEQLIDTLGTTNRGVKLDRLYVTRNTDMPAVLVEVGFISNDEDRNKIVSDYDKSAAAIARGITDYFQLV